MLVDLYLFRARCFMLCYCSLVHHIVDMFCLIFIAFVLGSFLFCLFTACSIHLCMLVSIIMLCLFVFVLFLLFVSHAILLYARFFSAMILGVHLDVLGNHLDRILVIFRFT